MKKISTGINWILIPVVLALLLAVVSCNSPAPITTLPTIPPATTTNSTTTGTTEPPTLTTPASTAAQNVNVDLTAQDLTFSLSTITASPGASVTINFTNKDSGTPHNFSLYTNSSAGTSIFVGQPVTGPGSIVYKFTAPSSAGTYFFRCDFHPSVMTGSFIVK